MAWASIASIYIKPVYKNKKILHKLTFNLWDCYIPTTASGVVGGAVDGPVVALTVVAGTVIGAAEGKNRNDVKCCKYFFYIYFYRTRKYFPAF